MSERAQKNAGLVGRRTVDVRWTRIEVVVIMDWLFPGNEAGNRD